MTMTMRLTRPWVQRCREAFAGTASWLGATGTRAAISSTIHIALNAVGSVTHAPRCPAWVVGLSAGKVRVPGCRASAGRAAANFRRSDLDISGATVLPENDRIFIVNEIG